MFRILRKIIFYILLILMVIFGLIYGLFHNKTLMELCLARIINSAWRDGKVVSLTLLNQGFQFPNTARFSGVKALLNQKGAPILINAQSLEIKFDPNSGDVGFPTVFVRGQLVDLETQDGTVHNLSGNGQCSLTGRRLRDFKGQVQMDSFFMNQFLLKGLALEFYGDLKKTEIKNLKTQLAGGELTGEISLAYGGLLNYSMNGKFKELDLDRFVRDSQSFYPDVKGRITGHFQLSGAGETVGELKLNAHLLPGGHMKSSALKPLLFYLYVPTENQALALLKDSLAQLSENDEDIELDQGDVGLANNGTEKLAATLTLVSQQSNLDLHYTFDVNIEGGIYGAIKNVLSYVDQIPKLKERL